ncbi:reverse transcriptase [Tanacetum coccineum]
MVADFIVDKEWNVSLLREHISATEAEMVLQIPISRTGSTDKLVWHFDPKGQYTVKSGYKHAIALKSTRDVIGESSANPSSKFWKYIWHIPVQPKIKLFLWKAISNLISTKENLFRRNCSPSPACLICDVCVKSVEHLLFECAWIRLVWFGSPICFRPPSPVFSAVDTAFKLSNAAFGIVVRDSTGYLRYVLGNTCHAISHLHAEIIEVHYACSLASDRG